MGKTQLVQWVWNILKLQTQIQLLCCTKPIILEIPLSIWAFILFMQQHKFNNTYQQVLQL
jgi:hypothetical protein